MSPQRGFLADLFDTSFQEFITPRIARVVYILMIIGVGLWCLAFLASAISSKDGGMVLTALVLGPLVFLLGVMAARIYMELVLVIFRIAENTKPREKPAIPEPPSA